MSKALIRLVNKARALVADWPGIVLAYFCSYGLMLFNDGIYQDDWTLYNMGSGIIIDIYHDQGHRWLAYFHNFLLSFPNAILVYHVLIFCAYLIGALILNHLLKRVQFISELERSFLVLFYAVLPVNNVRFLLINAPYAVSSCLFWLACWSLVKYCETKRLLFRGGALFAFFLAFDTNSFLVFYLLPAIYLMRDDFWLDGRLQVPGWGSVVKSIGRKLDFMLLPFLYWIPKIMLFFPRGAWAGYNEITARSLLISPLFMLLSFQTSLFQVLEYSFQSFSVLLVVLAALLAGIFWRKSEAVGKLVDKYLLAFGVIAFWLAVLPYNLVGLLPKLENWHSRHQLLVPLGASFILVYGLKILAQALGMNKFTRVFVLSLLLCQFVAANLADGVGWQLDWFRQQALIMHMRDNPVFTKHTTFIFDNKIQPDGLKRVYPVYQYAGMMKLAFGDERRIGVDSTLLDSGDYLQELSRFHKYFTPLWNAGAYRLIPPEYLVIIEEGSYKADRLSKVLSLKRHELLHPEIFRYRVKHMITLHCIKLEK